MLFQVIVSPWKTVTVLGVNVFERSSVTVWLFASAAGLQIRTAAKTLTHTRSRTRARLLFAGGLGNRLWS